MSCENSNFFKLFLQLGALFKLVGIVVYRSPFPVLLGCPIDQRHKKPPQKKFLKKNLKIYSYM